jgi:hypothetical protein
VVDKRGQGLLARRRFHPTTTKNELPLQPLKTVRIINVPANKTAGNSGHSKENVRYPSPSRNPWQVDYTQTGRVSFDHVSLTDTGSTLSRRSSVSLFSNCFNLPPPDSSTEKQRTESFALKSSVVPSWSRVSRHKITENAKTTLFNSPVVKNGTRTIPASISPFKKVTKRTPSHALFRGSSKVDTKKPKWSRMECPDSEIPDMDADSGIDELSFLLKKLR